MSSSVAAAPIPTNTPSLLKENKGKDLNVNLVPSVGSANTSSSVWGTSSTASANKPTSAAAQPSLSKPAPWAKPAPAATNPLTDNASGEAASEVAKASTIESDYTVVFYYPKILVIFVSIQRKHRVRIGRISATRKTTRMKSTSPLRSTRTWTAMSSHILALSLPRKNPILPREPAACASPPLREKMCEPRIDITMSR